MGFFVMVTFDLKGADPAIYTKIKRDIERLDLYKLVDGKTRKENKLPANTFVTGFDNDDFNNSKDVVKFISKNIKIIFRKYKVAGKYFISVGNKWAWRIGSIKALK